MSPPQTIREYLAALNASLEVGLRNRQRILVEVENHLSDAAQEQLRGGASLPEASRRAIAAFGSPVAVAARFDAGVIGALDRRLALGVRRLHRWMALGPRRAAVVWLALGVVCGGAVAVVGTAFGAQQPLWAAAMFVSTGAVWATSSLLFRRWSQAPQFLLSESFWAVTAVQAYWWMIPSGVSTFVKYSTAGVVILGSVFVREVMESANYRAARRRPGPTDPAKMIAWSADHPWRAAVAAVAPVPLCVAALVAVHPGPGSLRVALIVLAGVMAALAVAAVRLEQSRREKEHYQRAFEEAT